MPFMPNVRPIDRNQARRASSIPRRRPAALSVRLPGRTVRLAGPARLGRDPSCELALGGHGAVCPRHAELYRVGDLWWVRDLGSAGGTYLDGEVIDAAPVGRRATLRLGADGPRLALEPLEPETTAA